MTDILPGVAISTGHPSVASQVPTSRTAARNAGAPTPSVGVPVAEQPYAYRRRELVEPDWRRFPGWRDVTAEQWRSAQWQRAHCIKNPTQLHTVVGDLLDEE